MDLIRGVNPVPDELPAPPIQPVLRRLERGDKARGLPARGGRRPNLSAAMGAFGVATAIAVAVLAIVVLGHSRSGTAAPNAVASRTKGSITVRSTETLTPPYVTNGGVAATGRFSISGAIHAKGKVTDYRTVMGATAWVRRVVASRRGTITFVIRIHLGSMSTERWTITAATDAYKGLRGRGTEVVDNYDNTPATFVLKGTVW